MTNRLSVVRRQNFITVERRRFRRGFDHISPPRHLTQKPLFSVLLCNAQFFRTCRIAHRKPWIQIPSRAFAVEGEKSHKNQRRSTLHSPNENTERTHRRGPGATPDTSGLCGRYPVPIVARRSGSKFGSWHHVITMGKTPEI